MLLFKQKTFEQLSNYELYDLIQLRLEVFVLEQNCQYQDCDNKDLQAIHLMGFQNEHLVAYCRILPIGISYAENCSIGRVLTKKTIRNQSVGKELMKKAIEICNEKFPTSVRISAQSYLQKFYTDLGFEKITEEYLEDGIPHIGMLKVQLNSM